MRVFSAEAVKELCGGEFPSGTKFIWSTVEYFRLEDGVMQPYRGEEILPGPGILFSAKLAPDPLNMDE